ncbi:HAD family hydrolase [Bacillus sp. B1-b2]|uniref:HAD family hydrolase n=1 Tax=Bacillus sp. B1-b2 TaxID=2653201 RepID=UPI0012615A17|nr:HAD family hydrolase [Bacillus sp. B1-b2]KAB7673072.1 HAD family hydrolase [Bacillus sp. B1-b2]
MDNKNNTYLMVKEFHEAFGHEVSEKPKAIEEKTAVNRAVWTGEEIVEFLYATANGQEEKFKELYKGFLAGMDKAADKMLTEKKPVEDILVAQMDALTDIEYFNQGSFVIAGVEPLPLFKIVQEANMGKLFEDGKPRFREEDGKIIKPPNWEKDFAPEGRLKQEIERQLTEKQK